MNNVARGFRLGARLILSAAFLYAGVIKAMDPGLFAREIFNYRVLPWEFSVLLAFYLPWLEIAASIAIWIRRVADAALSVLALLLAIFLAALVQAQFRGLNISCGCFGEGTASPSAIPMAIGRDLLLLACVFVAAWNRRRNA